MEKAWVPLVAVAMLLTVATIAVLLLTDTSAPVGATPPAAGPTYQAAEGQAPSDRADDPTADRMSASETPRPETSPAPPPGVPDGSESSPTTSEQRIFKSRKALETVDPRELLRQATIPK